MTKLAAVYKLKNRLFMDQLELDKKFGCSWHVVVGEDFGFQITYEVRYGPMD
jgi:hypothetical protein